MARFKMQVSARNLQWPRNCACCCGPATTVLRASATKTKGKRVVSKTTRWWEVPYCAHCVEHIRISRNAQLILTSGIVLSGFFSLVCAFNPDTGLVDCGIAVAVLIISIWFSRQTSTRAKTMMNPNCGAIGVAVVYNGWYGTSHEFVFTNNSFLQLFVAANHRKTMSDVRQI